MLASSEWYPRALVHPKSESWCGNAGSKLFWLTLCHYAKARRRCKTSRQSLPMPGIYILHSSPSRHSLQSLLPQAATPWPWWGCVHFLPHPPPPPPLLISTRSTLVFLRSIPSVEWIHPADTPTHPTYPSLSVPACQDLSTFALSLWPSHTSAWLVHVRPLSGRSPGPSTPLG